MSLTPLERVIAEAENYQKTHQASSEGESSADEISSEGEEDEEVETMKLNFGRLPKVEECLPDDEVKES